MTAKVIPVKVAIRVRPFSDREQNESAQECIRCFVEHNQISINDKTDFTFDFVFDSTTTQDAVYDSCAAPLLDHLFKGYNCTMFAYGQTGSGKTYTMGTEATTSSLQEESRGIVPRMVDAIFDRIKQSPQAALFQVKCSMLEIYEERVVDLLGDATGDRECLAIREAGKGCVFVQGLNERAVTDLGTTMTQLEKGCNVRSKGETAMNLKSSRSHAVFTLSIVKTATDEKEQNYQAKLHLIDLAGSERLKKTMSAGQRMKEGIKINEGLLALGNVINALTDPSKLPPHVPYRNSKLTRLLQDSLGGNSYTVMIACISPADTNCEESIGTLRYAERAKKIENKPMVNVDPNAATIHRLRLENQNLRHELLQYKTGEVAAVETVNANEGKEMDSLRAQNVNLETANLKLQNRLAEAVADRARLYSQMAQYEDSKEKLKAQVEQARALVQTNLADLGHSDLPEELKKTGRAFLKDMAEVFAVHFDTGGNESTDVLDYTKKDVDDEGEEILDAHFASQFVEKQNALSAEMEELVSQIRQKEKLIEETAANHDKMQLMRQKHREDITDLEQKIQQLQTERDQLFEQLRKHTNASKISEERRKKLDQVEKDLASHKKTLQEMKRLETLKTQSDENVKKLRLEVQDMRKTRVRMVKQLREETDKFRKWQQKYEREVCALKQKDQKREAQMAIQKRTFEQKMTVYRRKYEEAASCNKRLCQQMNRQEAVRNKKFADLSDNDKLFKEFKIFLESELELVASTEEAIMHCDEMIEERKVLSRDANRLKRRLDELATEEGHQSPSKKKTDVNGSSTSDDESPSEKEKLSKQIEDIERQIDLRNSEIRELQVRCSSFDSQQRADQRWVAVKSTVHAKCALKLLFDMASESRKEQLQLEMEIDEMKESKKKLFNEINDMREEAEKTRESQRGERRRLKTKLADTQRQYASAVNEMVEICISAKDGGLNDATLDRLKHVQDKLGQYQSMEKVCKDLEQKNRKLSMELQVANKASGGNKRKVFRSVFSSSQLEDASSMPPPKMTRSSRVSKPVYRFGVVANSTMINNDDESVMGPAGSTEEEDEGEDSSFHMTPAKQQLQNGCACRGPSCSASCPCDRRNRQCTQICLCHKSCLKRQLEPISDISNEKESAALNETFLVCDSKSGGSSFDAENGDASPVRDTLLGGGSERKKPRREQLGYFQSPFLDK